MLKNTLGTSMSIPKVPAPFATFLLRIPLSVMFLQQGLSKFPVNEMTAEAFRLQEIYSVLVEGTSLRAEFLIKK